MSERNKEVRRWRERVNELCVIVLCVDVAKGKNVSRCDDWTKVLVEVAREG